MNEPAPCTDMTSHADDVRSSGAGGHRGDADRRELVAGRPRSTTTAGLTPRTVELGGSPTGSVANPAIRVLVWDSLVYLIPLSVKWDPLSSSTVSAKRTRCCCRWDPHLALNPIAPRRRLMREVLVDTLAGECVWSRRVIGEPADVPAICTPVANPTVSFCATRSWSSLRVARPKSVERVN
jgi:hypothetical protein